MRSSLRCECTGLPSEQRAADRPTGKARRGCGAFGKTPPARVALVGSYARGDHGPGSDADLLVVLSQCEVPFLLRALELPAPRLPVPADLVVLTEGEVAEWSTERPRRPREVLARAIVLAERER